jgi:hypothetical protein
VPAECGEYVTDGPADAAGGAGDQHGGASLHSRRPGRRV